MGKLISGAEIVFKALEDQNVEHVFGYPGGAILPVYDELKNHKKIKHILVRHEQGAGHAAEGYARSSGKPGVAFVTSGPGATNIVTALTDAYMDSIPIVCISGQVPTHLIGTDAFQECDTTGITRPCTKHNWLVKDVNNLSKILHRAFEVATTGRPGPVLVDIPKDIQFKKLGLAVVDEQHRFGVLQRDAIGKKGDHPHLLIMTATPIPRSLALTLYGDMDVSLLDESPPGRQKIATELFFENRREKAYSILEKQLQQGRQAFVVCPLIEESEAIDLKAAVTVFDYIQDQFPEYTTCIIHGKLKKRIRKFWFF